MCSVCLFSRVVLSVERKSRQKLWLYAPVCLGPTSHPPLQAEVPGRMQVRLRLPRSKGVRPWGSELCSAQAEAWGVPRLKAGCAFLVFWGQRTVSRTLRGPVGGSVWSLWWWWFLSTFDFAKFLNSLHTAAHMGTAIASAGS